MNFKPEIAIIMRSDEVIKEFNLKRVTINTSFGPVHRCFVGNIYDSTADGNTYHKLAVGALKNGWNPLYQDVEDFNKDEGNPFNIYKDNVNVNWVDHYARGTETFGAVVYAFTDNIESGKVYNLLWIYSQIYDILLKVYRCNLGGSHQ